MTATSKESASGREILLVGSYDMLGTWVIDAVAAYPAWRLTTSARRPVPTYRTQTLPNVIRHGNNLRFIALANKLLCEDETLFES